MEIDQEKVKQTGFGDSLFDFHQGQMDFLHEDGPHLESGNKRPVSRTNSGHEFQIHLRRMKELINSGGYHLNPIKEGECVLIRGARHLFPESGGLGVGQNGGGAISTDSAQPGS